MTIKQDLSEAKVELYNSISEAIERFQTRTEIEIVKVQYGRNSYATFPKTNFIGYKLYIDVGNES